MAIEVYSDHGWRFESKTESRRHCWCAAMSAFGAKLTPFAQDYFGCARKSAPPWRQPDASGHAMRQAKSHRAARSDANERRKFRCRASTQDAAERRPAA